MITIAVVLLVLAVYYFLWSLCRISAMADRANQQMVKKWKDKNNTGSL